MPARLTMPLTSAVTMISRRSGWSSIHDSKRSRTAGGKYSCNSGAKSGSSGNAVASTSSFERDLGVREEHGQLGRCEAESGGAPVAELLVGRERFDFTVEVARLLERAHEPGVHVLHRGGLFVGVVERAVLAVVVAQHEPRDLVGHGLRAARSDRRP